MSFCLYMYMAHRGKPGNQKEREDHTDQYGLARKQKSSNIWVEEVDFVPIYLCKYVCIYVIEDP